MLTRWGAGRLSDQVNLWLVAAWWLPGDLRHDSMFQEFQSILNFPVYKKRTAIGQYYDQVGHIDC